MAMKTIAFRPRFCIAAAAVISVLPPLAFTAEDAPDSTTIDSATLQKWSAPYRNWHYYPELMIPAKPVIGEITNIIMTDAPDIFQLEGDAKYYMTFIGYDGKGYQSFVAESDDLIHWTNMRLAMGYGPEGTWYHGGVVLGGFLFKDYDIKASRTLKKVKGAYLGVFGPSESRRGRTAPAVKERRNSLPARR